MISKENEYINNTYRQTKAHNFDNIAFESVCVANAFGSFIIIVDDKSERNTREGERKNALSSLVYPFVFLTYIEYIVLLLIRPY